MADSSIGNSSEDPFDLEWSRLVGDLATDIDTGDLTVRWGELQKVLIGASEIKSVALTVYDKDTGSLTVIQIAPIHLCGLGILAIYSEPSDLHSYRIIEGSLYGEDMGSTIRDNASFLFKKWPEVESKDWLNTHTDGKEVQLYRGLGLGAHLVTRRGFTEEGYKKYTTMFPGLTPDDFDLLCFKDSDEFQLAVPAYSVVNSGVIQKIEIIHHTDAVNVYE
jgi:hypothetical protein